MSSQLEYFQALLKGGDGINHYANNDIEKLDDVNQVEMFARQAFMFFENEDKVFNSRNNVC